MNKKVKKPSYTNINHNKRIALGLSLSEYCIADSINKLSTSQKWCNMSRPNMGKFVSLSGRQVTRIIQKLSQLDLVEIQEETGFVRSTERWINEVELEEDTPDKMSPQPLTKCPIPPDKMSHNKNINNNIDNVGATSAPFSWEEYLKGMENHKRKDLNIIGFFFRTKNLSFNTKAKAEVAIRRHLKAAKTISVFDKKEIGGVIRRLNYEFPKFTLETVYKELTK